MHLLEESGMTSSAGNATLTKLSSRSVQRCQPTKKSKQRNTIRSGPTTPIYLGYPCLSWHWVRQEYVAHQLGWASPWWEKLKIWYESWSLPERARLSYNVLATLMDWQLDTVTLLPPRKLFCLCSEDSLGQAISTFYCTQSRLASPTCRYSVECQDSNPPRFLNFQMDIPSRAVKFET